MVNLLTVDKAGRVVLPKPVREELQLNPGDSLELESSEERIVLRPIRGNGPLRKKQGVWVFRAGEPLTAEVVNRVVKSVRADRDHDNLGGHSVGRTIGKAKTDPPGDHRGGKTARRRGKLS